MTKTLCQALGGDAKVKWELQPTINNAGGLLCIWSDVAFKVEKVTGNGFIYLEGTWAGDGGKVTIINIYSPCDIASKRILRDEIKQLRAANNRGLCCILGDFNCIRRQSERVGVCQRIRNGGNMKEFNDWIADLDVEDVPSVSRKFTWYRPNGTSKSKIDRVLVSTDWFC